MLLILIWGVSWPVIKIGVTDIPPLWFACLRYAIATTCLLAVVAARGRLARPASADWPLVLVSGGLQMAAYSALTALALTSIPAGRASVLAFSTPLWVVPLAVVWLREPVTGSSLLGVGIGLAGVLVLVGPSLYGGGRADFVPYALLLGAAATWAVSIVFVRSHRFHGSALTLAPWQMVVATLLLLPLAAVTGPRLQLHARGIAALAYVGPIGTGLAYWAVVEVGRNVSASEISMALLAVPGVGLLISAVVLHERFSPSLAFGIVLITAGITLTTRGRRLTADETHLPTRTAAHPPNPNTCDQIEAPALRAPRPIR
jgi:drug/metabolite transporter (DMT)-like permease